jgi:cytochrome c2
MKNFKEFIDETKAIKIKSHKTVDQIAKKHRLDVSFIQNQLEMGIPIEHEHTRDKVLATDIALQHLNEIPDYYTRLKKMEASAKKEHKKFKDVKEEKGEIRYCSLCKKEESQEECKYGPAMWNINARTLTQNQIKFNTTRIHPANESVTIEDANGNTFLEVIDLIKPEKMKGVSEETKSGDSSLHDWFSKSKSSDGNPGWVQLGGRYAGKPCAKQPGQNTKPKCGSSKMAANMSDEEEDAAARRKRKEDPNPNRSGQAKNVKTEEFVNEDACKEKVKSRYKIWPSAYASGAVVKCRKVGAANWGNKTKKNNVSENYLRIQTRGTTYTILLNWRGKYITTQMFFQQFTRPTKVEVTREVRKVYPNAIVLAFNPSLKDPTKPLLFTGQTNEPR